MPLRLLVLIAFALSFIPGVSLAAGPITSGTTNSGTITGPTYRESWTFAGVTGQRILVTALTTSGALNTTIVLKAPGGIVTEANTNSGDRLDWTLAATGTYTIEVQDYGLANTGNYAIGFLNITAGPLSGGGDTDGGPITSADITSGTMSGPGDIDAFSFTGTLNHRVIADVVATAGAGFNTYVTLFPPNGGVPIVSTASDRIDVQLTASGTWTIVVEDNGDDTAGSYSLSMLNVTAGPLSNGSDTDGALIQSNQIVTGNIQAGVDFDAFTFHALAGSRIVILGLATGGSINTTLALYPPNGGVAEVNTNSADTIDWKVLTSGVYTLVVEDYGNDETGPYTVSLMNVTAGPHTDVGDADGGGMLSSQVKTGTMSGIGDMDVFTFSGGFGERVIIDAVATAGAGFNTYITLYPPNGGAAVNYTASDRMEWQLNASGVWTVLVQDNGSDTAGSYALSLLNVTVGPLTAGGSDGGGPISSNQIIDGQLQQGVDFDAYTFNATVGQRVIVTALATGGGAHNTSLAMYPPGGGAAEVNTNSADGIDAQVQSTGVYTVVVEDYGNDNAGAYTISFLNLTAGPLTSAGDPDGGPITSAAVKTGTISGIGDMDAWTFTGNVGERVVFNAVATAGAGFNTYVSIYPPNGGSVANYSAGDRMEYQLHATGTWTILIQDNGSDTAGDYEMSLLNITAGPHEDGADTDGNILISNTNSTGTFQQGADFDAYTFAGSVGQRVYISGLATGPGGHNTTMTLYPPGGGTAEGSTNSTDVLDVSLLHTGTYTLVIEDYGNDNTGDYLLTLLNITAGPLTDGADPDGGPITSADVKAGTIGAMGDLDAYTFTANPGARILIDAVVNAGPDFNTYIFLYPPNGGPAALATASDRTEYQVTLGGTWTVIIADNGLDHTGSYQMSVLNVTAGPISNGGDADGGAILSNEIKTGQFHQGVDFDAFTFSGTAGQRVVIAGVATGAGTHNTSLSLYPPGGFVAEAATSSGDRIDVQLLRTGTYTIVVEDYGNDHAGAYAVSLMNVTGGPLTGGGDANGGPIVSNDVVTGTISGAGDFDAYTFPATSGQRILVVAMATGGAGFNTSVEAFPPSGAAAVTYTTSDRIEFVCNATGLWTLLIEDSGNDVAGNYTLSMLNVTAGPYSNGSETDGGPIEDNVTRNGSVFSIADVDGYTFYGVAGMTASIAATATSGTLNTNIALYPPNGGNSLFNTTLDNFAPVLPQNGWYTLVVEDFGDDETGNYTLNVNLSGGVTGIDDTPPVELALHPAVPSPFSQTTRFDVDLPARDRVRIDVYDVTGARIRSLVDQERGAGRWGITWDGRDDAGARVASGVYYVRMQTRTDVKRQKVVLVR